ncbi:FixH family protein [Peribacillus glennii]|uniref:YtkA-like domain-containing protein n=1 Tax=Peribacillus glennii TaxID=2303991 RepID=A0A372L824_9BACI|nr:FixH family protein [Peribacillus glennii]RFU61439.1 hypothetical protein D0466_18325 [Peribacillus glennii]
MKRNLLVMAVAAFLSAVFLYGCSASTNETAPPKKVANSHHEHSEDISFEIISPINNHTGLVMDFKVVIMHGGHPLSNANVDFEFWKEGETNHQVIEAAESKDGIYYAKLGFQQKGEYTVKIHVEKGSIHEHKEMYLTVE